MTDIKQQLARLGATKQALKERKKKKSHFQDKNAGSQTFVPYRLKLANAFIASYRAAHTIKAFTEEILLKA